ncbi:MAG TPA: hypothetical protein VEH06_16760 [Candidatus Bathyarchaeia archaeon]|nr:hypothetical protein [Candidatus Bathyarchaeia archaeon]
MEERIGVLEDRLEEMKSKPNTDFVLFVASVRLLDDDYKTGEKNVDAGERLLLVRSTPT